MGIEVCVRFDMRAPEWGASRSELYATAHAMAEFADQVGFHTLLVGEHHGTEDGYTSAPFVVAASLAARTRAMRIRLRAVLLPLHDPVHFAEELATLDVLTDGRAEAVLGLGYVPSEFAMFGLEPRSRVRRLEKGIEILTAAVSGQAISTDGRRGRISPLPVQEDLPLYLGGGVLAAARRAARFGLGFAPHLPSPELLQTYEAECARGNVVGRVIPNPGHYAMFVTEDPDDFWRILEPHARHNANEYSKMAVATDTTSTFVPANPDDSLDDLKKRASTWVVTPDECIELAQSLAEQGGSFQFVPLLGGLAPEFGWSSLRLFADEVLPELKKRDLLAAMPTRPDRPVKGETL
ncbi:LLM class flavin-dependent oxidoreductase [Streptomyces sp. NPDC001984]|uniref:LLM class flavin-dependent oxidoreductase n=1 Tax=Streptomyces sp. NPDC002619 TaxID=3364655 RepID=UPI003693E818